MWSATDGFPSADFLGAVHPRLADVVQSKMPGRLLAPGDAAGGLTGAMARRLGLREGTPVSAAIIDAHAGVPGAGAAEPGTLVMVMGTSSCHMLNSDVERRVPGVAGVVKDGILPGYFGYETGQAAVGDAFDWLRRLTGQRDLSSARPRSRRGAAGRGRRALRGLAQRLPHAADGRDARRRVRRPRIAPRPAHLYRALLEASAFGVRWIVEMLREGGVPVRAFVATGGLPHHNPLLVQIYADVLGEPITVHPSKHGPALGAAMLGALAAGAFASPRCRDPRDGHAEARHGRRVQTEPRATARPTMRCIANIVASVPSSLRPREPETHDPEAPDETSRPTRRQRRPAARPPTRCAGRRSTRWSAALTAALNAEGVDVVRAHPYKPKVRHGFIASQREGIEVFRDVDPDAPLIVAEAVWQYSHHVLPGLTTHRGPILTVANWSRPVARAGRHAEPQRLADQGRRRVLDAVERGLHRRLRSRRNCASG